VCLFLLLVDRFIIKPMLPKKQRLKKEEIAGILKRGGIVSSPSFRVRYLKTSEDMRVAPVVSKKISKLAVKRNSLRRKIYETVSPLAERLKGFDMVIFLQKNKETGLFDDLKDLLLKIK